MKQHHSSPFILLIGCLLIAIWASVGFAGYISPNLQAALDRAGADTPIPVIIHLSRQVDRAAFKRRHRGFARAAKRSQLVKTLKKNADAGQVGLMDLLGSRNIRKMRSLWIINGIAATLPAAEILEVAGRPDVARIEADRAIALAVEQVPQASPPEWNIAAIQADALWDLGYGGQGVVVAVMDSGVDLHHPDLAASYRGGSNSWFDPHGEYPQPTDNSGHGTGVLSVVVGGDAGGSFVGVAPQAQWMAVKIFNSQGQAPLSAIHAGFQWLLDPDGNPDTDDAPDIVNNSWGFDQSPGSCDPEFSEDIALLKAADIAVVFSGGNSGPWHDTSVSPGNDPQVIAVGAVDPALTVADFSARGPSACTGDIYPQVTAPGVGVRTADLTFGGIFPDSYFNAAGSSYAAPHVAGSMALLLSAFPDLTPAELEQALIRSAVDLGSAGPDNEYGYGMIDVLGAFEYLDSAGAGCTDDDGDGFFDQAGCGTQPDCRGDDGTIFPGAHEIRFDGIDQDCNGYDLTIRVASAFYHARKNLVSVVAYSELGPAADLKVKIPGIGVKRLHWVPWKRRWQKVIPKAVQKGFDPTKPSSVIVSGMEGTLSRPIRIRGPKVRALKLWGRLHQPSNGRGIPAEQIPMARNSDR